MRKVALLCGLLACLFFAGSSPADTSTCPSGQTPGYVQLILPAQGGGFLYPIYAYSVHPSATPGAAPALTQLAYATSESQNVFLGQYCGGLSSFSGVFELYYPTNYPTNSTWSTCTLSVTNGNLDASPTTTCTGAVLHPSPSSGSTQSNITLLSMGGSAFSGPATNLGYTIPVNPPNPVATDFTQNRTLTFVNNTQYSSITIGEVCTLSVNPGYSCTPSGTPYVSYLQCACAPGSTDPNCACQNNPSLCVLKQGDSCTVTVGKNGLTSSAFIVSGYVNSKGVQVNTGGYYGTQSLPYPLPTPSSGVQPYATKMEFTFLPVVQNKYGLPSVGDTNMDLSAVDGFNFGAVLYPATPTYCTYNLTENGGTGAGLYSPQNPMATLNPTTGANGDITPLQQMCVNSSQLAGASSLSCVLGAPSFPACAWNLTNISAAGAGAKEITGCYSPCSLAKLANQTTPGTISSDTSDQFCCAGNYATPATCMTPPTSSYVQQVSHNATRVYSYAYDDANGDFGCRGMSNFVVSIVTSSSKAPTTNKITTPPSVTVHSETITTNSANVSWTPATDSDTSQSLTYSVQVLRGNGSAAPEAIVTPPTTTGTTAAITGLSSNAQYQVVVTAQDTTGATGASTPVTFTTTGAPNPNPTPSGTFSNPNIQSASLSGTTLTVAWTAASTDPAVHYTVTAAGPGGANAVTTVQGAAAVPTAGVVTYVDPSAPASADHVSVQAFLGTQSSTVASVTVPYPSSGPTPPPNSGFSSPVFVENLTDTTATLKWGSVSGAGSYNVVATPASGAPVSATTGGLTTTLTGLSPSTAYTATVTTGTASTSTQFTTLATPTPPNPNPTNSGFGSGLVVQSFTDTTATLAWGPASGANAYTVTTSPASAPVTTGGLTTQLTGLSPGTAYTVTVTAGSASTSASFTTSGTPGPGPGPNPTPGGPPTAPSGISVSPVDSTTATVSWTKSTGGTGTITYTITAAAPGGGLAPIVKTTSTPATLKNLVPGTTYQVTIQAQDAKNQVSTLAGPVSYTSGS